MKILAIDDSNTIRFILLKVLRELGYKDVLALASAQEAIALVENEPVGMILLDWNMPQMNGLQFLQHLRGNPATAKIPVIMLTTMSERSCVLQALKVGVQGYLVKPIDKDLLGAKLEEVIEKYGLT